MDLDLRFAEIQRDKAVRDSYAFVEDWKSVALAQGREEGLQKGRSEERKQIALKMLKEKVDIVFICKITGLTEKEIKKLK